ncbi:MAG: yocH 1 [Firmicutes bacterium]|nr:yocH 1 [Bacillota bacterium]
MSGTQLSNLRKLGGLASRNKVVLIMVLVITSLVVTGFVWAHKRVNIIADGKNISIKTIYNKPEEILAQANIYLGPNDECRLSTPTLVNNTTIEVYRSIPVAVTVNGKTEVINTGKPTAGELAASLGFSKENSRVIPSEDTRLTSMMDVKIVTVTEKLVTQKLPLESQIIRQPDNSMETGVEETAQIGEAGQKEVHFKVSFEDGHEVSREVIDEKVLTPAKPQIIRVGTRDTVETSRGAMRFRQIYRMEATAYNPTDGSGAGITASGIPARHGIVAVDPAVIPLGSRVFIPGYGLALAADTGGAIRGHRIDLCMESYGEASSFGRRMVKVYVIAD